MPPSNASPPFASPDGKPANQGTTASGAHDFVKDPSSGAKGGGGFDVTKQNRPQSEADPRGAGNPNSEEIPAGGKTLLADPGSVGKNAGGPSQGPNNTPKPYKSLK